LGGGLTIQALVVGQPLNSEILGILEDYEISQVRFFESGQEAEFIFSESLADSLLIFNRNNVSDQFRKLAIKLAKAGKIEILEFDTKVHYA
jgi:hypothetical protein